MAIQDVLVEVLEANKYFVNQIEASSEALSVKTFKHLDEIEFQLKDGVLTFKNYRVPIGYYLSNLSNRGGDEALSYVLDKLVKSA
jgi:hypothetical protein